MLPNVCEEGYSISEDLPTRYLCWLEMHCRLQLPCVVLLKWRAFCPQECFVPSEAGKWEATTACFEHTRKPPRKALAFMANATSRRQRVELYYVAAPDHRFIGLQRGDEAAPPHRPAGTAISFSQHV